jgi:uncharacterized protein GlcG (DUF336 family)
MEWKSCPEFFHDMWTSGYKRTICQNNTRPLPSPTQSACYRRRKQKPQALGIPYNIAIVDSGGHLVAFVRQDDALIGSIDLAIDKAATARFFDKTTSQLASLAQSGKPLFGIQESNAGKVVIFGGGIPIVSRGRIIGAVGTSAGTVEQDIEVAEATLAALAS